jgi:hypothetical protein
VDEVGVDLAAAAVVGEDPAEGARGQALEIGQDDRAEDPSLAEGGRELRIALQERDRLPQRAKRRPIFERAKASSTTAASSVVSSGSRRMIRQTERR